MTQAGKVFIWGKFQPTMAGYRDLGNGTSPAFYMNISKYERRNEWRGENSETESIKISTNYKLDKQDTLCGHL